MRKTSERKFYFETLQVPIPCGQKEMRGMSFAQSPEMKAKALAIGQGVFYLISGLWPIVHYRSFEKVTGPKTDDWLVKTVGGLITMAGVSLLTTGLKPQTEEVAKEAVLVGAGHALVLGTSAGYYSLIGRISKIYFLDAVTEYTLIGAWLLTALKPAARGQSDGAYPQAA
jgi:hypothetical protein